MNYFINILCKRDSCPSWFYIIVKDNERIFIYKRFDRLVFLVKKMKDYATNISINRN
ncbi:MAG: hypothetical protein H6Q16_1219 [Bacteroidetes bacterium]|nr:hypothetical protein [Bacteroidota bacterium]